MAPTTNTEVPTITAVCRSTEANNTTEVNGAHENATTAAR